MNQRPETNAAGGAEDPQADVEAAGEDRYAEAVDEGPGQRRPLRRMILRNTAALPALTTLMNGIAGFASIYYATRGGVHGASLADVSLAAWLILVALAFDALDGRLARMTRQATDFGAQLDSLCDVVSFGVAPAVLMLHTVSLTKQIEDFDMFTPQAPVLGKVVMAIALIYVCCGVLRLARFNIENAPDLLRHMFFKGLPVPGAAAVVASLVLLFGHLQGIEEGWKAATWLHVTVGVALPATTLTVALLMISRFPYPHLINRLFAGRRSFGFIVWVVVLIVPAWVFRQVVLPLVTVAYAASGPANVLIRRMRRHRRRPKP